MNLCCCRRSCCARLVKKKLEVVTDAGKIGLRIANCCNTTRRLARNQPRGSVLLQVGYDESKYNINVTKFELGVYQPE